MKYSKKILREKRVVVEIKEMISVRSGSQVFTHRVECDGLKNSKNVKEDLDKYGYALLRGLIKREDVLRARDTVKEYHEEKVGGTKGISYTGIKEITHHKDVLNLLDAPKRIFKTLFRGKQIEISKTIYLRLLGQNETTSTHSDAFFFKSKPKSMYTCWIPFGDVRICDGPLAVCESSHEIEGYDDDIAIREEIPWGYVAFIHYHHIFLRLTK